MKSSYTFIRKSCLHHWTNLIKKPFAKISKGDTLDTYRNQQRFHIEKPFARISKGNTPETYGNQQRFHFKKPFSQSKNRLKTQTWWFYQLECQLNSNSIIGLLINVHLETQRHGNSINENTNSTVFPSFGIHSRVIWKRNQNFVN